MELNSIFHITEAANVAAIAAHEWLVSDERIRAMTIGQSISIGFSHIKDRRMRLPVGCHKGTTVGQYVPFFYCPRSVMLYQIHVGHGNLRYSAGERRIVHLEFSIHGVVSWATHHGVPWAVADGNASIISTRFTTGARSFDTLDAAAINATHWAEREVKQRKMAEFLVFGAVPWRLVARIGVADNDVKTEVATSLAHHQHVPTIDVRPEWYYGGGSRKG